MTRIIFFTAVAAIGLVGGALQWLMYRQGLSFLQGRWTLLCFLVPVLVFVGINLQPQAFPLPITRALAWLGGLSMGFFYYSVFLGILFLLCKLLGYLLGLPTLSQLVAKVGFYAIWVVVLCGMWNAVHPVTRVVKLQTSKVLTQPVRIAFVSDIHLGALFGTSFAQSLVERVNAARPDVILLGGDIVDGDLQLVKDEGSYLPFSQLKATYGTYAVYGNHDLLAGTQVEERELLRTTGMQFVCNSSVAITPEVKLTGLDDYSRNKQADQYAPVAEADKLELLMEHQPRHILALAEKGYDLYFAGHTHAGQFFPNNLLTRRMYSLDYGTRSFGSMVATVSNGFGLWGIPMRVGPAPEIVLIEIEAAH